VLILNGENVLDSEETRSITINNVCFPSSVSPKYAPSGKSLASITVVGIAADLSLEAVEREVTSQLCHWWGDQCASWKLLKTYR